MAIGLPVLVLLAAQASTPAAAPAAETAEVSETGMYGPLPPRSPKPVVKPPPQPCPTPDPTKGEVIVCAEKFEGYRIDPDVLEAQRLKKKGGQPRGPERLIDNSCQSVGPHGCTTAGINVIAAAMTLVAMVDRLTKGESVKDMFITDPTPDDYDYYKEAKRRREAREAEAAAKAAAAAKPASASSGQ